MQKGGKLAQYAPPAELLMYPADAFVEDFVGSDRALKRLALQRVRDIDLWKAPLVRVGEPVAEARAKVADSDLPYPLLVDGDGTPLGWLRERALAGRAGRATSCARGPSRSSSWTTCCATRSPTCSQHETQYGPVVDARGAGGGRALGRGDRPRAEGRPGGGAERRGRRWRGGRDRSLAQVEIRDRSATTAAAWPTTASAPTGSPTTSTATWTRSSSTCCSRWCRWRSASRSRSRWRCSPTAAAG